MHLPVTYIHFHKGVTFLTIAFPQVLVSLQSQVKKLEEELEAFHQLKPLATEWPAMAAEATSLLGYESEEGHSSPSFHGCQNDLQQDQRQN